MYVISYWEGLNMLGVVWIHCQRVLGWNTSHPEGEHADTFGHTHHVGWGWGRGGACQAMPL